MSEFYCHVVQIDNVTKHPNADALDIINVYGGYPCIVRNKQFSVGDRAVYVSVDAMVPSAHDVFAFLWPNGTPQGDVSYQRIKAKKLRGIFSMGLLVAAEAHWQVGDYVAEQLGVRKYEPMEQMARTHFQSAYSAPNPKLTPVYDLEGYRHYGKIITPDDYVVVTEKVHGTSAVYFMAPDGTFYVGSHRTFPLRDNTKNVYWDIADKYDLEQLCSLSTLEGIAVYGEIYGRGVQKGYDYGTSEPEFTVFDMYDMATGQWLPRNVIESHCYVLGLPLVPCIYEGHFVLSVLELAEGTSHMAFSAGKAITHAKEGIVIECVSEPTHVHYVRRKLKYVSEQFLLSKHS